MHSLVFVIRYIIFVLLDYFKVVPYTECKMGMEPQEFTETVLAPKLFVEKTCTQVS